MSAAFERFGGMAVGDLQRVDPREFEDFADRFGTVLQGVPFQLPQGLLFLMRASSLTSGVCSALDPSFNIWAAVEPHAERLLREEQRGAVRDAGTRVAAEIGMIARLPRRVDGLLDRPEEGRLDLRMPGLERRAMRLERAATAVGLAIVFAALLLAGALLRPSDPALGLVLLAGSAIPAAAMLVLMLRR